MNEKERLEFVKERDGVEGMLKFAKQTLFVYVRDSVEKSIYSKSVEELVNVLKEYDYEITFVDIRKK